MLRISKLTDYATVILSFLAFNATEVLSATRIAKDIHLSTPTVSKILKILAEAGLVKSFRGAEGGYQLIRRAEDISLAEIIAAIEGNLAMTECCDEINFCNLDAICSLKENWQIINKIIIESLKQISLKDMSGSLLHHPLTLRGIPIKVKA